MTDEQGSRVGLRLDSTLNGQRFAGLIMRALGRHVISPFLSKLQQLFGIFVFFF